MKNWKVLVLMATVLLVGIVGTYLCSNRPVTKSWQLTIAVPTGPTSSSLYVANDKGFLSEGGLETTVVPFSSGRLALEALLAGKAQVALVAETPLALAAFQTPNFYVVATIAKSPHKLV